MTWIDVALVALPLLFTLFGLFHGIVRQAASWAGLIAGHLVAVRFYPEIRQVLKLEASRGSDAAAYLAGFLTVYFACRLVGALVERWVRASRLSGPERLAGGLAGLVKGSLLAILLVFLMTVLLPRGYDPLARSRFAPRALYAGALLVRFLPPSVDETFRSALRSAGYELPAAPGRADDGASAPPPDQPKKRPRK